MLYIIILLVLALAVLGAMYYVYRMAFHPVPTKQDRSAKALNNPQFRAQRAHINQLMADLEARPYELVSIVARDGTITKPMARRWTSVSTAIGAVPSATFRAVQSAVSKRGTMCCW